MPSEKSKRARTRPPDRILFFGVSLGAALVIGACTLIGAILVPALAGPRLPPRAAAFIAIGCFLAGAAVSALAGRWWLKKHGGMIAGRKNDTESR